MSIDIWIIGPMCLLFYNQDIFHANFIVKLPSVAILNMESEHTDSYLWRVTQKQAQISEYSMMHEWILIWF